MTTDPILMRSFGVGDPKHVAKTTIADIWQVRDGAGATRALKIYRDGNEHDEGPGLSLLQSWQGDGAVQLLARQPGAVLMEWLHGPSLGDAVREGDDIGAAANLADTARRLHQMAAPSTGLTPLADRCAPLFAPGVGFASQQTLARDLLATAPPPVALHGDLHHDNVLLGPRGWCAIDPKGIWGDPSYEMANAFRNPVGAPDLWRDPERAARLAQTFADILDLPVKRLLGWAAVHVCLSILWDDQPPADHPDADLPDLFLTTYRHLG